MRRSVVPGTFVLAWLCLALPLPAGADAVLAPGEPLTPAQIADLVTEALAIRGNRGRLAVEVDEPKAPLPNGAAAPMRVSVAELRYDPRTGRYDARLTAFLPTGQSGTVASAGRVEERVEVAVLSRPVARGATIRAEDVALQDVPARSLGADALQREEELVGKVAARPLPAGRAVRARDLVASLSVRRGEPVTMVFARGGLELTGVGTALDQGREGDMVRVENAGSGEVRRAVVLGPRRVRVDTAGLAP
jgi:flagella basal body P-ring formation protein FlgA